MICITSKTDLLVNGLFYSQNPPLLKSTQRGEGLRAGNHNRWIPPVKGPMKNQAKIKHEVKMLD